MKRPVWLLALLLLVQPALARAPLGLAELRRQAENQRLLPVETYASSARAARAVFLKQGGLVQVDPKVPTVIVPDMHGQRDYLMQLLEMKFAGTTVFEGMRAGKLNVLCLGDASHTEWAVPRWLQAEEDYQQNRPSPSQQAEMVDTLGILKMIMDLKVAYPSHFFFVRGNHEDMVPERPYGKFCRTGESVMVLAWVRKNLGEKFVKDWHDCELAMPLVANGGSFVGSHAPPEQVLTLQEIGERTQRAFRACCWSDNTKWRPASPQEQGFEANCRLLKVSASRPWLCGHRKVEGALYRVQMGGKLVQFNPLDTDPRIVVIAPAAGKPFKPERDVKTLPGGTHH